MTQIELVYIFQKLYFEQVRKDLRAEHLKAVAAIHEFQRDMLTIKLETLSDDGLSKELSVVMTGSSTKRMERELTALPSYHFRQNFLRRVHAYTSGECVHSS